MFSPKKTSCLRAGVWRLPDASACITSVTQQASKYIYVTSFAQAQSHFTLLSPLASFKQPCIQLRTDGSWPPATISTTMYPEIGFSLPGELFCLFPPLSRRMVNICVNYTVVRTKFVRDYKHCARTCLSADDT